MKSNVSHNIHVEWQKHADAMLLCVSECTRTECECESECECAVYCACVHLISGHCFWDGLFLEPLPMLLLAAACAAFTLWATCCSVAHPK